MIQQEGEYHTTSYHSSKPEQLEEEILKQLQELNSKSNYQSYSPNYTYPNAPNYTHGYPSYQGPLGYQNAYPNQQQPVCINNGQ